MSRLLDVSVSASLALTEAVSLIRPGDGARTCTVTVTVPSDATDPKLQVSTLPAGAAQLPCVLLLPTKLVPDGRLSVSTTPVAPVLPLLSTRRVYSTIRRPGSGRSRCRCG